MRVVVKGLEDVERFAGTVTVTKVAAPRAGTVVEKLCRVLPRQDRIWIDGELNAREWNFDTNNQAPERLLLDNGAEAARVWAQWDKDALYLGCRFQDAKASHPITLLLGTKRILLSPDLAKTLPGAELAGGGHAMEARLPWAALGPYRPAKGDKLRWDMELGDGKQPSQGGGALLE